MYVIIMKDVYGGIYLSEQILYYTTRIEAREDIRDMIKNNRDTCYTLIKVDLTASNYIEYKDGVHDIRYEGKLYKDIEKCLSTGEYEMCAI